ncbi:hypothetical protein GCM10020254_18800 [Streptomyces goshikiensis]
MLLVRAARPAALRESRSRAGRGSARAPARIALRAAKAYRRSPCVQKPAGGQGRHRAGQAGPAHFEREQPAEGVPRDVRAVDAQRRAERPEGRGDGRQVVRDPLRQRRGGAETGKVDGDDVVLPGQDVGHGVPGLEVVADAVQQEKRFAGALAFVGDGGGAGTQRRIDREGDRGGHAAPRRVDACETDRQQRSTP